MRKVMGLSAVAAALALCAGCFTAPYGAPVSAPIQMTKGAGQVVDNGVPCTKVGKSMAKGIILVGLGDASIDAAVKAGGIKKIHHVDTEQFNILGIYCEANTVVYGE